MKGRYYKISLLVCRANSLIEKSKWLKSGTRRVLLDSLEDPLELPGIWATIKEKDHNLTEKSVDDFSF